MTYSLYTQKTVDKINTISKDGQAMKNYHNPENVPESELPEGHRFMTKKEVAARHNDPDLTLDDQIQARAGMGWARGNFGSNEHITYCVPIGWGNFKPAEMKEIREKLSSLEKLVNNIPQLQVEYDPKLGHWPFIRACKTVVFVNPREPDPFDGQPLNLVAYFGVVPGVGEITDKGELKCFSGEIHEIETITCILPV